MDEWTAVRAVTPDKVQAGAGTAPAELKAAVDLLVTAKSPLFIYGPAAAMGERGRATVTALSNLAILLGQGDRLAYIGNEANSQGARDMGLASVALPGAQPVTEPAARDRLGKLWGVQPPEAAGLTYDQMLGAGTRALFVMGADPAAETRAARALRELDCLIVQDLFLTETARLADVVLPATSFAEADGTYTNLERRVQRASQGIRAVGESRPDWAILTALAGRWLAARSDDPAATSEPDWKKKRRKGKQAPAPKPWNYPNAQAVLEEITKAVPAYASLRWEALGQAGMQWSAAALARPSRRVEPAEAAAVAAPTADRLWLVSGPLLWDNGLLMQYGAAQVSELAPEPFVALNPADCAAAGLSEGTQVSVASADSTVSLTLRADASVQPGTAWVPACLAGRPAETLGAGQGEPAAVRITKTK